MHSSPKPTSPINAQSTLTEADFEGFTEFCFSAAFQPQLVDNVACLDRKTEMSHIISHAVAHHGFIRSGRDKRRGRRYITVCQGDRQFPSGAVDCQKCGKIHTWEDKDLEDSAHAGDAICLRCWCRFTKRDLCEHLNGPLCPYNAEKPKSRKMMMLYTTFCSDSKPPTLLPKQPKQPNEDLVWPLSLKKMKLSFILDSYGGS